MSQADTIREFVCRNYIQPAREKRKREITISAGEIGRKMGLYHRIPNVCNALGGKKLEDMCGVRLIGKQGPLQSTTTSFTYEILERPIHVEEGLVERTPLEQPKTPEELKDIPNILRELHKLKEEGVITEEEFERKKKELLDKI